ncbi:plantaricin C family lantibiotic (plasmid) [Clostridium estertheticum]|uniref:plantaricin C family lantibiotic n=1 Tax=Clostridium estertheticum TaxID=238834 RepID=UPI002715259F|nr:plantaricin C family lantibiotic [Clostridium estertheticum]WLC73344.1 plantaricin C family lantibiotic [Clostridium estertheticum]
MNISKRNPLLRNNVQALDAVIGNLGEEMKEQQLSNVDGGTISTHLCATVYLSAVSIAGSIKLTKWILN